MRLVRGQIEILEANSLAPYAVQASASRGRAFTEQESAHRTAFQKDHDRVVHTTAFRRLEYKTQVFLNYEGDYYRTRLTHSLEVAQVGRSIARALGLNQDLTETLALAHDLGHPPFGHSGEGILAELMQGFGGFDHNQQSFRIVTHLEKRYPDFRGLNLTYETREGMVKHDPGFSREFAAQYQPELWPSLEAQIANLADEIAYTAHDLDDGLRSGLLAASALPEVAILVRIAASRNLELANLDELGRRILVRELLGELIEDAIGATDAALEAAKIESPEQIRTQPEPLAGHTDSVWAERQDLRSFLYREFYFHPHVVRQAGKAHTVLARLFESYTKNPRMLPRNIQAAADSEGLERAVCDYLAGMTDRFALDEYARIFDPYTH